MKESFYLSLFLLGLIAVPAFAGVDTVKTPSVKEGAVDFKYKGKYEHDVHPRLDGNTETEIGLTYGVTRNWKSEIEAGFVDKPGVDFEYRKFKLQNYYNFSDEGAGAPVSMALYAEVALAGQGVRGTHTVTGGFVGSKKLFGNTVHTGNLLLRRDFGETALSGANLILRGQSRYDASPAAAPAVEIFYDNLRKDRLRDQSLRLGPTLSGTLPFEGAASRVSYDIGYFFGLTRATPGGMLRWILKYEF